MREDLPFEMATLTSSGDGKDRTGSFSLCARDGRIKTMCAPLSTRASTGKESAGPVSTQFQMRCLHLSGGGGLTEGKLLFEDSVKETSSSLSSSGKRAATRLGLSGAFVSVASETTPTVVLHRLVF